MLTTCIFFICQVHLPFSNWIWQGPSRVCYLPPDVGLVVTDTFAVSPTAVLLMGLFKVCLLPFRLDTGAHPFHSLGWGTLNDFRRDLET